MKIKNTNPRAVETIGALLIRNSWGTEWGPMGGYLWLPYEYVLRGLAVDWWSLLKNEWVETGNFRP
jgi:Cysteine protease